jgi:cobalamin biosynthesis protein CobC
MIHGGRLSEAQALFPDAPRPWIDLSTGINPWPYPAPRALRSARARLPDPMETAALEQAAARTFGVAGDCVLATAGTEAAIRLLAACLPARTVAVVEPTYGGHRDAWNQAGAEVVGIARGDLAQAVGRFGVVVLVNPNNPDGARIAPAELLGLASNLADGGGWLIIDEAFVETAPELSVSPVVGPGWSSERLVTLRSFGKFHGLPGLRLGFVTGHPPLIADLRRRQGEWPVSADAIAAGLAVYADASWAARTRVRLDRAAARLDRLLRRAGMEVLGGTSLFRLARAADAPRRFARLAARGVLARPFTHDPTALRFGLPSSGSWSRLADALMESRP